MSRLSEPHEGMELNPYGVSWVGEVGWWLGLRRGQMGHRHGFGQAILFWSSFCPESQ